MDAGTHGQGPERSVERGQSLLALQIQRGRHGVAGLADDRSAARLRPNPVAGRVRATVGFLAHNPENLCLRSPENLTLLLNAWGIYPVFSVHQLPAAGLGCLKNPLRACHGLLEHRLFRKAIPLKPALATSVVTREGLLDD